eukprot:jgi/Orpsp1_1/1185516/evm.model.c7180000094177.1
MDSRIRVFHNHKIKGLSQARNLGIKKAKGEYIGFIESTDYVDEQYFENLYNHHKNRDVIIGKFVDGTINSDDLIPTEFPLIHGHCGDSIWRKSFLTSHKIKFPSINDNQEEEAFRNECYKYNPIIFNTDEDEIYYHYKSEDDISDNNETNSNDDESLISKIGLIVK